jgi:hypothetical protein
MLFLRNVDRKSFFIGKLTDILAGWMLAIAYQVMVAGSVTITCERFLETGAYLE